MYGFKRTILRFSLVVVSSVMGVETGLSHVILSPPESYLVRLFIMRSDVSDYGVVSYLAILGELIMVNKKIVVYLLYLPNSL